MIDQRDARLVQVVGVILRRRRAAPSTAGQTGAARRPGRPLPRAGRSRQTSAGRIPPTRAGARASKRAPRAARGTQPSPAPGRPPQRPPPAARPPPRNPGRPGRWPRCCAASRAPPAPVPWPLRPRSCSWRIRSRSVSAGMPSPRYLREERMDWISASAVSPSCASHGLLTKNTISVFTCQLSTCQFFPPISAAKWAE